MKITVQLVVCDEDGHEETFTDRGGLGEGLPAHRAPRLHPRGSEVTSSRRSSNSLVEQQATAFVAAHAQCDHCGKALGIKEYHTRTFRTLVWHHDPDESTPLSLSLPAAQDHHLPAAERPADRLRSLPSCCSWRRSGPRWSPMA